MCGSASLMKYQILHSFELTSHACKFIFLSLFDQLQKYVSLTSLDQTTIQCNGTMLSVVASLLGGWVLGT